jgi:dTDP-glucose 4,6-dehydratase
VRSDLDLFLVTGGAGFIGSSFVLRALALDGARVVNLDKLTYAGNLENLASITAHPGHRFVQGDVCDASLVSGLLDEHRPRALVHFAAQSHVDRSIDDPAEFIRTNVTGTFTLLEAARTWLERLAPPEREAFRFVHVSTDEVFGSAPEGGLFDEHTPYAPSSPYSASKAAADHLVRAYHRTYGLPTIIGQSPNNYGPRQFPEKLVPLTILNALEGRALPVYGDGRHVRDWLYVEDHCDALLATIARGAPGATYLFGSRCPRSNLETVRTVADLVDELTGRSAGSSRALVTFVHDRPGHDRRYAVDPSRAERELGWRSTVSFDDGLRRTVRWYLDQPGWCRTVTARYRRERLGTA